MSITLFRITQLCDIIFSQILDLLWSDPSPNHGCRPNTFRGGGSYFGPDITRRFLAKHNLELLVRSHECKQEGYEFDHRNKVTIAVCLILISAYIVTYSQQDVMIGHMADRIKLCLLLLNNYRAVLILTFEFRIGPLLYVRKDWTKCTLYTSHWRHKGAHCSAGVSNVSPFYSTYNHFWVRGHFETVALNDPQVAMNTASEMQQRCCSHVLNFSSFHAASKCLEIQICRPLWDNFKSRALHNLKMTLNTTRSKYTWYMYTIFVLLVSRRPNCTLVITTYDRFIE